MSSLLVLSDSQVRSTLLSLDKPQVERIAKGLTKALIEYSVGDASCGGSAKNQMTRMARTRANGDTNLFMPAMSSTAMATKMLNVPSSNNTSIAPHRTAPRGLITLLDPEGDPLAILAAEEITAFRTALAALLLLPQRKSVGNILVFGAGKQAIWHIRLALLLRGRDVHTITIVNRSSTRTDSLLAEIVKDDKSKWSAPESLKIQAGAVGLKTGSQEYIAEVKTLIGAADAIFCTTPATAPLFEAKLLTDGKEGRYITAIGSYKPNMLELEPEALTYVTSNDQSIIVDTREGALEESGEIIKAGIGAEKIKELGEVFEFAHDESVQVPPDQWLQEGLVIYKGVGCGIMDVAVSEELLPIAREHGLGTVVDWA